MKNKQKQKLIIMIVKIENKEQEKFILECATKDGFTWSGWRSPLFWIPSENEIEFPIYMFYKETLGFSKYNKLDSNLISSRNSYQDFRSDIDVDFKDFKEYILNNETVK